jgi:hypothetical protein
MGDKFAHSVSGRRYMLQSVKKLWSKEQDRKRSSESSRKEIEEKL